MFNFELHDPTNNYFFVKTEDPCQQFALVTFPIEAGVHVVNNSHANLADLPWKVNIS